MLSELRTGVGSQGRHLLPWACYEAKNVEDEDYQRHLIAMAGAADAAIESFSEQRLPLLVPLPIALPELGPKNNLQYQRLSAQIPKELGGDETLTPFVVGLAFRMSWFSAWTAAHYIRLSHENLPPSVPLTEENYSLWQPTWHLENGGFSGCLTEALADRARPQQLQLLLRETPFNECPSDAV